MERVKRGKKINQLPDFDGKVIYVALEGPKRYNLAVASPHWENHGGNLFLVGVVPPQASYQDWTVGTTTGIAWEHITEYTVFDSVEDYHRRFAPFDRKKRKT